MGYCFWCGTWAQLRADHICVRCRDDWVRRRRRPATMSSVRYLITGGAGFIGSALVKRLLDDGHEVRVLDDMSRGNPQRLAGYPCQIVTGDIRNPSTVLLAMQGCERVVHLAYLQGTQTFYANPRQVLDVALRGILNVLGACERTGCADLLLVSSSEAYQVAPVVPTPEDVPLTVPDPLNVRRREDRFRTGGAGVGAGRYPGPGGDRPAS